MIQAHVRGYLTRNRVNMDIYTLDGEEIKYSCQKNSPLSLLFLKIRDIFGLNLSTIQLQTETNIFTWTNSNDPVSVMMEGNNIEYQF